MRTYDNYKDSGIQCLPAVQAGIGEIPGWKVKKFGTICYMKGRIGWQGLRQEEFSDNETLPFLITGMNFKDGIIRWNEVYHITEERFNEAPEIQLKENDLLMTKDGTIGKLLFISKIPFPFKASLNSHLLLLRPLFNSFYPKFLYYQLDSEYFRSYIELAKTGTTFYGITQEAMGKFRIFLPPLSEQTAIANYLDSKTTEIDQVVADKEALVSLYEEEKKALINEAVTKGLNKYATLKPSGVEWLEDIPEHWEVKRLKYLTEVISKGTTPSTVGGEITDDANIVYIKAENIKNNELDFSSTYFIDEETNKLIARSTLQENDILFVIAGATIGKVAILSKHHIPANTNQAISFIRLNKDENHQFVWYWLQSIKINEQLWLDAVQSAQPNLSMENLGNFYIPYPTKSEQTTIVQYIESETANINDKINQIKQEIALLKEYRQALIFEAVTGKIRVFEG